MSEAKAVREQFVEWCWEQIKEGMDIDGGAAQDKLEELGIIEARKVDPATNEWGADELYFLPPRDDLEGQFDNPIQNYPPKGDTTELAEALREALGPHYPEELKHGVPPGTHSVQSLHMRISELERQVSILVGQQTAAKRNDNES